MPARAGAGCGSAGARALMGRPPSNSCGAPIRRHRRRPTAASRPRPAPSARVSDHVELDVESRASRARRRQRRICATVLSLDTSSGLILSGLPISQDKHDAPTIMMSRDTTRMTSQRGITSVMPSVTIDRDDQRLVGQRIEIGAELARHAEALGEKAVDRVAHAGGEEQQEGNRTWRRTRSPRRPPAPAGCAPA